MKTNGFVVMAMVMLLVFGASVRANLLVNGDFNNPTPDVGNAATGWTSWTFGGGWVNHQSNPTYTYNGSLYMVGGANSGTGGGGCNQIVPAAAGVEYVLTVLSGADTWWLPYGEMRMLFLDAGSVQVGSAVSSTVDPLKYGGTYDTPHPWASYSLTAVAPVGTTQVKVEFAEPRGTGSVWFENAVLVLSNNLLKANTPTPASSTNNIPTSTTDVTWLTALDPAHPADPNYPNPAVTKHYVYMRENDPNLAGITPVTVSAGSPVNASASCSLSSLGITLAIDKAYYWRVDESVNNSSATDPNTIHGTAWVFSTPKSVPVITTQPVSVRVSTPAAASFTTVFTSISTPTATWYKNGVLPSGGAATLTNVGTTYTATLTFATTANSNQADYYCVLAVPGKDPVQSDTVSLVTKKLLAEYNFENNLNDSSTFDPHNGTGKSVADPNVTVAVTYDTGLVGSKALVLDGTTFVDLGVIAYPKGSFTGTTLIGTGVGLGAGMDEATISCWVKATAIGGLLTNYNDNILANSSATPPQLAANTTGFGMELAGTGGDSRGYLRGELAGPPIVESVVGQVQGAPVRTPAFNMLGDGKWHQVAVTWKQGGTMVAYTDGVQVAVTTAIAGTRDIFYAPQRGPVIGGIRTIADRSVIGQLYHGLMDDLRVYNYAMDNNEVATLYYNGSGQGACNRAYANQYDFNLNCVVDLGDFMVLAENWLSCGRFPLSTCP